jgi:abortive infection bacteriophage resistance protein
MILSLTNSLEQFTLCMDYHSDKLRWKNEFMPNLSALINEHSDVIDLRHIGFPEEWEILLA